MSLKIGMKLKKSIIINLSSETNLNFSWTDIQLGEVKYCKIIILHGKNEITEAVHINPSLTPSDIVQGKGLPFIPLNHKWSKFTHWKSHKNC